MIKYHVSFKVQFYCNVSVVSSWSPSHNMFQHISCDIYNYGVSSDYQTVDDLRVGIVFSA